MTTIKIGSLGPFDIMFDSFSESYQNEFEDIQTGKTTQPARERWGRGKIDNFTIELTLVAGVTQGSPAPQSGADIVKLCETAMGMSVQRDGGIYSPGPIIIPTITVAIGSWYKRQCVVHRCECEFLSPWDEQGQPMRAKIRMTFQVSSTTKPPQRDQYKFNR